MLLGQVSGIGSGGGHGSGQARLTRHVAQHGLAGASAPRQLNQQQFGQQVPASFLKGYELGVREGRGGQVQLKRVHGLAR